LKIIKKIEKHLHNIPSKRKEILDQIVGSIKICQENNQPVQLMFVCTHNSRRSQFGQIWALILADFYGIELTAYSGGTEVTKVHPTVIDVFKRLGVDITPVDNEKNQKYRLSIGGVKYPIYSKLYDDVRNPNKDFIAVMTCSEAAENCPYIHGCLKRIPLSYEDPKVYDGTEKEQSAYKKTSNKLAREMIYIFHRLTPPN
jgi:protein-tyrosine-phosphatase